MALSSQSLKLLVPAADVLAKNMRAQESARIPPAAAASDAGGAPSGTRRTLIGMGAATEQSQNAIRSKILFRRAVSPPVPSPITTLLAKLFPKKPSPDASPSHKPPLPSPLAKLIPPLEKAAALASNLPDPTLLFLAQVLLVLLIEQFRPHWLSSLLAKVAIILSFLPLFLLALLWRKTELFATLREGQNPLSHPAEHRLDAQQDDLTRREAAVTAANAELAKNRAQLDALRKELAKDPHAADPAAIIVPSRKAAAMIAAGALGAGYDADAAHAVEQRRKEESVRRSREAWRVRTEETEVHGEEAQESLKLLADHAAKAYTKRTRELKSASGSGGGAMKSAERLINLRKVVHVAGAFGMGMGIGGGKDEPVVIVEDDEATPAVVRMASSRVSRRSESITGSVANSTVSNGRKRRNFFRKKKRSTNLGLPVGEGLPPTPPSKNSRTDDVTIAV